MISVAFVLRRPLTSVVCPPSSRAAAVALAMLLATGCGSEQTPPTAAAPPAATSPTSSLATSSTSTSPPTESTTSLIASDDPTAEVESAIDKFWAVYLDVGGRTGPFNPTEVRSRLEERSTGESLQTLFDVFQGHSLAGYVVRGEIDSTPQKITIDGDWAEVVDCIDDVTGLYRADTGERQDVDDPLRRELTYELIRDNGVWKVSAIRDGGTGCTVPS